MLTLEEYTNLFQNIKDKMFENCITEHKLRNWDSNEEYISYEIKINQDIKELFNEYDQYNEISDVVSIKDLAVILKDVYYDEINMHEFLEDKWYSYQTTYKCYQYYEGNLEKIKNVLLNKINEVKEKFVNCLINTYDKYCKAYEIKKDYIEFAENIKKAGFKVCECQRRGEIRVPSTFSKDIDALTLFVRKNIGNYRVYMKCAIGGRYGMTVEDFDRDYKILKQETNNIKNALMNEEII